MTQKTALVKRLEATILARDVELTPTALALAEETTQERWLEIAEGINRIGAATAWWWGDWSLFGARKGYGEVKAQAEAAALEYGTLHNCRVVAAAFELERRRSDLPWGYHQAVLGLPPEEQEDVLATAEDKGWSRREVREEVKRRKRPGPLPLPPGKYAVIYADPPWSYENSGFEQSAATHYPTMETDVICDLAVADLAGEHCVLFLWATSPLLPDALQVMDAWGFSYKAHMVWVKDRAPGMGWWLNTKHELLLIGARGEEVHPAVKPDSVVTAPVTEHSRKPDRFAELIEEMYPRGPWVELFARQERPGWNVWGNEVGGQTSGSSS